MTTKDFSLLAKGLRSGDIVLMDRLCLSMREPLGIALCLLNKTECCYDHVAMILKLNEEEVSRFHEEGIIDCNDTTSSSGTYILETNMKGVSLRSFENRLSRSSAKRFAFRNLHIDNGRPEYEKRLLMEIDDLYKHPYKTNFSGFIPSFLSTPDKMDRVKAAYKLHLLKCEVTKIDHMLLTDNSSSGNEMLQQLRNLYINSAKFLSDIYFPHLNRTEGEGDFPSLVWSKGNYVIDGCNHEKELFCSELITRLWHSSGILIGFPPASSFRPFDFLDDTRFNFTSPDIFLGDVISVEKDSLPMSLIERKEVKYCDENKLKDRLHFFALACGVDTSNEDLLDKFFRDKSRHGAMFFKWLIQSNTSTDVRRDLAFNCFSVGLLFAMCGLLCAPFRLCWLERQLGIALQRGSVWSLAVGCFTRDIIFAFTQAATCLAVNCFAPVHSTILGGPVLMNTKLFDARHPYYYICPVWLFSTLIGHIVTTPVNNAVLGHHFGPLRAGPLPMRILMSGTVSLAPLCILLPYIAAWITWYETLGSAVIPTPSSILRRRSDLIISDEWNHFRFGALSGAFAATLVIDLVTYPLQTRCRRAFLAKLYRPLPSPCFGRSLFTGYSYRLMGNIIVMFTTAASLCSMSII